MEATDSLGSHIVWCNYENSFSGADKLLRENLPSSHAFNGV